MKTTITIARQLGSGGSYVGQGIAAALGFRYLDRDVLQLTAQALQREEREVARREERVASFWERVLDAFAVGTPDTGYVPPPMLPISDDEIFRKEMEIVSAVSAEADCVVIGRAAAHALSPRAGMINLLLHAPVEFRVRRVQQIYDAPDEASARRMIAQSDAMREKYVARMTGRQWLRAENYHLALDASRLPLDEIIELLVDYIRRGSTHAR